ncbi:MAG: glycosyltransferase family 39 protein [Planctomycetes bacterium]|nr:glycosyltransferase family 39 protein [Planctomycetota bacterium]
MSPRSRALHAAVVAFAFVALAFWSWGKWPDVLVDFGRECYAPWRLAEGDVLYRDLAWFNGPLSPYFNALAFEIGGASLRTLFVVNLAVLAVLTVLVWRLIARLADPVAASAACVVVLALCGFGQLVGVGNYNFVAPYSHEATHGLVLTLLALECFECARERRSLALHVLGGLCVGLAWLTKVEMALAATVVAVVRLALERRAAPVFVASLAACVPTLVATVWLGAALTWSEAWFGATSAWRGLVPGDAAELAFYRSGMGLDQPEENAIALLTAAGAWLAAGVFVVIAGLGLRNTPIARGAAAWIAATATAIALWFASGSIHWLGAARPLPLALAALLIVSCFALRDPAKQERAASRIAFASFAFVLLLKMILNARVQHYGFALALPAIALVVAWTVHDLPAFVARRGGSASIARSFALGLLALVVAAHLEISNARFAKKTVAVGEGADRFLADVRGEYLNQALAVLAKDDPKSTLAVFPEGVMANFLLRRRNPTPFVNFMPPELLLFGEAKIVDAFRAAPPDRVLLVHKDTSEYGFALFGADYGRELATWISANYRPLGGPFGDPPLTPSARFGVQILTR